MRLKDAKSALDAARSLMKLLADGVEEVSPTQALVLVYFDESCPVGRVKHWGVNPSYNISHLCALGYLRKDDSAGDGRRTVVHLTAKGADLAMKIQGVIEEAML